MAVDDTKKLYKVVRMQSKETELLTFFDFPIEQFADRSARWLLEDRENVRGLLGIFAENLATHLDFGQLFQINRNFIPDNLREQEADLPKNRTSIVS